MPISVLGCLGKGVLCHSWILPTLLILATLQQVSILWDIITLKR